MHAYFVSCQIHTCQSRNSASVHHHSFTQHCIILPLHLYVCTYTHVFTYAHVHVRIHVHMHAHINTYTHTYMQAHAVSSQSSTPKVAAARPPVFTSSRETLGGSTYVDAAEANRLRVARRKAGMRIHMYVCTHEALMWMLLKLTDSESRDEKQVCVYTCMCAHMYVSGIYIYIYIYLYVCMYICR